MPVRTHTGAEAVLRGPSGERFRVFVMGPSGLLTIDAGIAFTYAPGSYEMRDRGSAGFAVSATTDVAWAVTWDNAGNTSQSTANGVVARGFSVLVRSPRTANGSWPTLQRRATITATTGGTTYTWIVTLISEGGTRDME